MLDFGRGIRNPPISLDGELSQTAAESEREDHLGLVGRRHRHHRLGGYLCGH